LPLIMDPVPVGRKKFRVADDQKRNWIGYTASVPIINDQCIFARGHIVKNRTALKIPPIYGIFIIVVGMVHYYLNDIIIGKVIPYDYIIPIPARIPEIGN